MIFAIDPGTTRSAWVLYDEGAKVLADAWALDASHGILPNVELAAYLRMRDFDTPLMTVLIEKIESYGMAVGEEVFTTVMWVGRFIEALHPTPVVLVPRKHVKMTLCGSMRAKDPNIRQALIDRWGEGWKGTKAAPGPLYGIAGDEWSALAVAVAWAEAPL